MNCATHPGVVAVETCVRCGAFACGDCLELLGDEPFCATCYARQDVSGQGSVRAILALLFSSAGLLCGAPFGIVGLVLAWQERRALDRGAAPLSSRSFVKVARILGWVSVVLTALVVAGFVVFTWFIATRVEAPVPPG